MLYIHYTYMYANGQATEVAVKVRHPNVEEETLVPGVWIDTAVHTSTMS